MGFAVGFAKPHDKWINELCSDKYKISQFLNYYKFVGQTECVECGREKSIKLLTQKRDLDRNRLPYRCVCNGCSKNTNFLADTYLYGKSPSAQIGLLYKFYLKRSAKDAAKELDISYNTAKSQFDFFRDCIHDYMQKDFYPNFKFSTEFASEWDESAQGKQKHNRGNKKSKKEPRWLLGGIQRKTGYVALQYIKGRDAETLQSFIEDHSQQNSTHFTDGHKGYFGLDRRGFYHFNVIHKDGFSHPMTKAHTNTIESLWGLLKFELAKHRGIPTNSLQKYLDEFAFRRNTEKKEKGVWRKLCLVIATKQHSVNKL